jgi:3-hydroxyisobutyrate dehydrogenase
MMKVAFIGLGTMGVGMSLNILKAGFELTVHNRTREKEEAVAKEGAARAASPAEAAKGAEVIVCCVTNTAIMQEIMTGENGVIEGAGSGAVVVDMSTVSPEATREVGAMLAGRGVKMVDAPVSGGPEGANLGTLSIMIGGDDDDVKRVWPVLDAMGKTLVHVGPLGAGQMTKAINQILIAGTYLSVAEAMVFGMKAGLDMEKVLSAVGGGAAASWVLDNRARNVINNEYPLGFKAVLHRKDLGIALATAKDMGVALPVSALCEQLENGLVGQGKGDDDMSALGRILRSMAGMEG